MSELAPTVGRIVLVRSAHEEPEYPGIVTHVWSRDCINVKVFPDSDGLPYLATSLQPQDFQPTTLIGWRWPPRT